MYVVSLVLMATNFQRITESCMVIGFVGLGNSQRHTGPIQINPSSTYYSPVSYPGIFTEHAASEQECASVIKIYTIIFGVVVFVVQFIQVGSTRIVAYHIQYTDRIYVIYRFTLLMLLVLMLRDCLTVLVTTDYTLNKSKTLKKTDTTCLPCISVIMKLLLYYIPLPLCT